MTKYFIVNKIVFISKIIAFKRRQADAPQKYMGVTGRKFILKLFNN